MDYQISLISNNNGVYDVIIHLQSYNEEFSLDFLFKKKKNEEESNKGIIKYVKQHYHGLTINSIRVIAGGIVIALLYLASNNNVYANSVSMGYLYEGTEAQQIQYVKNTKNSLNTVAPSYFDIINNGSLQVNYISIKLMDEMREKGIKVTPFLSNHWDRAAGVAYLNNYEQNATELAELIIAHGFDGINIDIENVTHLERENYTNFIRVLREKLPPHKIISVAVAANPSGWTTGWHGSYDYNELAQYSDYLMIMAYDEHYQTSEPGPVASINWVENSITYALKNVTSNKLVLGIPFFGRIWSADKNFNGIGIDLKDIEILISVYNGKITFDEISQSPKAEFTIKEGDIVKDLRGKILTPGLYTIWFEDEESIYEKISLVKKYNLAGTGNWAIGKELPSIWDNYAEWLGNSGSVPTKTPTPMPTIEPTKTPTPEPTKVLTPKPTVVPTKTPTPKPTKMPRLTGTVKATLLNVRSGPSTKYKIIAILKNGSEVSISSTIKNWYKIELSNGKIGYVNSNYIKSVAK